MDKIIVTTHSELETLIQDSIRKIICEQSQKEAIPTSSIICIDEACRFLNLAKQTIYSFTSKRIIPHFKRGKKLYFRLSELENWVLEGKKKSISDYKEEHCKKDK